MVECRAPGETRVKASLLVSALGDQLDSGAINSDKDCKTVNCDGETDNCFHLGCVDMKCLWADIEDSSL